MAEIPFVDTHVHFSDLQDPNLYYAWLQPGWKHPILGDIEGIQAQRYWADEFVAETRFSNVKKSDPRPGGAGHQGPGRGDEVAPGVRRPAGPSPRHRGRGASPAGRRPGGHRAPHGIPNMRGVRDFGPGDYLVDDAVAARATRISRRTTWSPAWTRRPRRTPRCARSPRPSPTSSSRSTTPASRASATRSTSRCGSGSWQNLAGAPNVVVKISGLGMCDNAMDRRVDPSLGPDLHRDVRRRAQLLRQQLAGRSPLLQLPRRPGRLRGDHQGLLAFRAGSAVLRQRRAHLPDIAAPGDRRPPRAAAATKRLRCSPSSRAAVMTPVCLLTHRSPDR